MNGSVIFFEEYEICKPDFDKMDKKILTNVVSNCSDKYSHSIYCEYVCDIEFKDIKDGKTVKEKIRGDEVVDVSNTITRDIRETIFGREKNFDFVQCIRVVKKCWMFFQLPI